MATYRAEIWIEASPARVYAALTQPELIQLWQYGRSVLTDWQIGSPVEFSSAWQPGEETLRERGTILDMQPNALVKYRSSAPRSDRDHQPGLEFVTSYVLHSEGGQTRVELIREDLRTRGFVPASLTPILVALKHVAEQTEALALHQAEH